MMYLRQHPAKQLRRLEKKVEKIVEQGLLYDFYGELLTDHQKQVYEDAVYNNMSLSEIAEEQGISRQGVHDLIKRCDRILADYESKLHLVEKFQSTREKIEKIRELNDRAEIEVLVNEILEEL